MELIFERLRFGSRLDLGDTQAFYQRCRDGLLCVVGGGRGSALSSQSVSQGIWIPLRGKLQIAAGDANFMLEAGHMYVSEPDQRVQASGRGAALWVALLAPPMSWRRALQRASGTLVPAPVLVPAWHNADIPLRRQAVRLVRAAMRNTTHAESLSMTDDLLASVLELQEDFATMLGRCPGRTLAQRYQVFLRLQRVRNLMAASCHLDLGIPELARMASYSTWHFIRAFRTVYGETPHAYLVRQRLDRARRLVRTSTLAISEIALAIGFENRCAFSRLFKQRFGVSAADLRRAHGGGPRRVTHAGRRVAAAQLPVPTSSATPDASTAQLATATNS